MLLSRCESSRGLCVRGSSSACMYVCVCECYLLSEHETVSFLLAFYVIIITFNVPLFIFALISAFTLLCTSFFLCFAFLILIRRLRLLGSRPKRCDQRALRLATATEWRISACECAKATHTATHTHIGKHTDTVTHTLALCLSIAL